LSGGVRCKPGSAENAPGDGTTGQPLQHLSTRRTPRDHSRQLIKSLIIHDFPLPDEKTQIRSSMNVAVLRFSFPLRRQLKEQIQQATTMEPVS